MHSKFRSHKTEEPKCDPPYKPLQINPFHHKVISKLCILGLIIQ